MHMYHGSRLGLRRCVILSGQVLVQMFHCELSTIFLH